MARNDLIAEIISAGQSKNVEKLEKILEKTETKQVTDGMLRHLGRPEAMIIWNFMLNGLHSNSERTASKRFHLILSVLNELYKKNVPQKQCFDIVTRLFIELPKLTSEELVDLCQHCIESLKIKSSKCTGWKELLPELIKVIIDKPKISANGETMTGTEFRTRYIGSIFEIKWQNGMLSNIASMFNEMKITRDEKTRLLKKLCENIQKFEPLELPALAYQLFSLCSSAAHVFIPLFSFNHYFHNNYYKKVFSDLASEHTNFDSIEEFSEKELCEAQDTILYHLSACTEFNFSETNIVNQFRALASNPRYILTPFLISALLTMCNMNRYFDSTRLAASSILPFLRSVILNNELEREMSESSYWCRNTSDHNVVDLTNLFTILIDQSKDGADVVTAGLIALSFTLLKAHNSSAMPILGMKFLEKFVRKRFIYGSGILKSISEFLFADQEAPQYAEVLTLLSTTNTLTVAECVTTIREIINFFLLIPGQYAMRMMQFLVPIIKMSNVIRDHFIETMRKAMFQSNLSTRQAGIFGFCLILKELRNNNSCRGNLSLGGSQFVISGYSLMSQQVSGNENNPSKHFDMTVLEIIGILRKCFNQTYEIKEMLYDSLSNTIEQNIKLVPHILQFLECHFRNYFEMDEEQLQIKFDKCIIEKNNNGIVNVQVWDNIGKLLQLVAKCVLQCKKNDLDAETEDLVRFLSEIAARVKNVPEGCFGMTGNLSQKTAQIGIQYLNCIESLMYFILNGEDIDGNSLETVFHLFEIHLNKKSTFTTMFASVKRSNRKKVDPENSKEIVDNSKAPAIQFKPNNIWTVSITLSFLKTSFCEEKYSHLIISNIKFVHYILNITAKKVEAMRSAPDYLQIKYSKSNFRNLSEISSIIFTKFIVNLEDVFKNYDDITALNAVECFFQCIRSAVTLYERKFKEFLTTFVRSTGASRDSGAEDGNVQIVKLLQKEMDTLFAKEDLLEDADSKFIPLKLIQTLELLLDHAPLNERIGMMNYNWLLDLCKRKNFDNYGMTYIFKILFKQHVKLQGGLLFDQISQVIEKEIGQIEDEEIGTSIEFSSITELSAEYVVICMCNSLSTQINHIEYFIRKINSYYAKLSIGGLNEQYQESCEQQMKTIERRICSQMTLISSACLHLTNTKLPLGNCMDALIKLLTHFYICLTNLTKHFIVRNKTISLSMSHSKYDLLIRTIGKSLPIRVYRLISYIEDNIDDHDNDEVPGTAKSTSSKRGETKKNSHLEKAKIMRDTRNIPKLILRIENFHRFVTSLGQKIKQDLSKMLHLGTVRDFRIRASNLREAVERLLLESQQLDVDEESEDLDNRQITESDESSEADENNASGDEGEDAADDVPVSSSSSNETTIRENPHNSEVKTQNAIQHLNAINRRSSKRKKENVEHEIKIPEQSIVKRRSRRK